MKNLLCIMLVGSFGAICHSSAQAEDIGRLARVSITDRDTGVPLIPYRFRGEYWVAGRPGARYAIEIRNELGERLLAVTSVDGVNVVSGDTAGWDQNGYVFGPNETYAITGWRKSEAEVAAFTFTASPQSYAELTGRPANVGVIGIALFRERAPRVAAAPWSRGHLAAAPADANSMAETQAGIDRAGSPAPMDAPTAKLGTGHGEREYSYADRTVFLRAQPRPNEIIRIRYDSFENLWAMGVIPRRRAAPAGANPFPASPPSSYVPDPPG
jgi:hypothetical protein